MATSAKITLEHDSPSFCRSTKGRCEDVYEENETGVVRLGAAAAVETTFSDGDRVTRAWFRKINGLARARRLRAPLVVGLVALRGHEPNGHATAFPSCRRPMPHTAVRAIALCVGGSHVLVYKPNAAWEPFTGASGRIEFDGNKMQQLHALLGDARVTVACLGAGDAAEKLARSWGLHVARPTDLKRLVERAYGKDVEVDDEIDGRMEKRRVNVKKGLGLEGMALLVLGPEMQLEKTPAKVAQANWGDVIIDMDGRDELMYATRDAYLCFEIAVRCIHKLGGAVIT